VDAMSLFGALYIGNSGLNSSQNGLNTVAHNLSNINTDGYVRQQVSYTDTTYTNTDKTISGYNVQIGDGVKYAECRRVRDQFLDATYREENGRMSYYDTCYSAVLEIEDTLGEFTNSAFKDSLTNLWTSLEELSKSPNDTTNISVLVQKSAAFMENASSVYKSLQEYQNNLNDQVINTINDINSIGKRISELNKEISSIEGNGVENANDLRDERDYLLDTLAGYGNIAYTEDAQGVVSVRFNGTMFITDTNAYEMCYLTDKDTGFVTPYWKQNLMYEYDESGKKVPNYSSAYVFDLTEEVSTANDTDVGSLRALLLARGDHIANYTDLRTDMVSQQKLDSLRISADNYDEEDGYDYYNKYISNSIVMNVEAEFDNLINSIVTKINGYLADYCDPKSGYLCNDDGSPIQMFLKVSDNPYEKVVLTDDEAQQLTAQGKKLYQIYDENGEKVPNTYWQYIEEDAGRAFSLYNCGNIEINEALVQTPAILGYTREDGSVDYPFANALLEAFQNDGIYLNPNATAPTSFENSYIELVNQLATTGSVFKGLYDFETLSVETAENERQTVIGVSSDEELEHMMMYQNAYNAASRYITVINDMLETLISVGA
jgi:flagellar hook-associated protein 1 FlgK